MIVKNVTTRGGKTTSSLSGDILIDESNNRLIVRDPTTHNRVLEIDKDGVRVYRSDGTVELASLSTMGLVYSEINGIKRILLGAHPVDGHIGEWITKIGTDVIKELGG